MCYWNVGDTYRKQTTDCCILWKASGSKVLTCAGIHSASLETKCQGSTALQYKQRCLGSRGFPDIFAFCLMSIFLKNDGYQGFCTYIALPACGRPLPTGSKLEAGHRIELQWSSVFIIKIDCHGMQHQVACVGIRSCGSSRMIMRITLRNFIGVSYFVCCVSFKLPNTFLIIKRKVSESDTWFTF